MYTYTWKKYLPVIRILLKRPAGTDQTVSLNRTDFEKTTKLRKPACSFSVEVGRGRMVGVNPPVAAKDLLSILQEDSIANQLIRQYQYSISLNSDFILTIKNITPAPAETTGEE